MKKLIFSLALIPALVATGCSGDNNTTPDTGPVIVHDPTFQPVGTLQGVIVDSYDQAPIPGAKVTVHYQGTFTQATTDAAGTFAFVDLPASDNPGGPFSANGSYSVVLDLSAHTLAGRTYEPFRTKTVEVVFTALTAQNTGNTLGEQDYPNGVHKLVSNVTFKVHQKRAKIAGKALLSPAIQPAKGANLLLVVSDATDSFTTTGAVVGQATCGDDGAFSFSAIEEGLTYRLALADLGYQFDTGGNNYNPNVPFRAYEMGATTTLQPVVLMQRPVSDNAAPYIVSATPKEDEILAATDLNKDITLTFNEAMVTSRSGQLREISSFRRVARRGNLTTGEDANVAMDIPFAATWNATSDVLKIDPLITLWPGFRYKIVVVNSALTDAAGNARTGNIPNTNPVQKDALALSGAADDFYFEIAGGTGDLTITGLTQEPDTADNQSGSPTVRALVLSQTDPTAALDFYNRQAAAFYGSSATNQAYIYWTAPATPVLGYYVYTRGTAAGAPVRVTSLGSPLAPTRTAVNYALSTISTALQNAGLGLPGIGLPNATWNDNLKFDLGVSALGLDGLEGPIAWTTLSDNTAPIINTTATFGYNYAYANLANNDSVTLTDNQACQTIVNLNNRMVCPAAPLPYFGGMVATSYGERILMFDLSEPVRPESVIAGNLALVNGTLQNINGIGDPNGTEPDGTILDANCAGESNGRCSRIAVKFGSFFSIDTGDKLILKGSSGAITDLAGNDAEDTTDTRKAMITAAFVDQMGPTIKAVAVDAANDTITLTMNKSFVPEPPSAADQLAGSNIAHSLFAFRAPYDTRLRIVKATYNPANPDQVVLQVNDVGFMRGYNQPATSPQAPSQCNEDAAGTTNCGTRIRTAMENIDFNDNTGFNHASTTDYGYMAYVNLINDPVDIDHSPGAYLPTGGIGTRKSWFDSVGPRLSNEWSDRQLLPNSNAAIVPASGIANLSVAIHLTEATAKYDGVTPTSTSKSACNPANWTVVVYDLGGDLWATGNPNGPASLLAVRPQPGTTADPCPSDFTLNIEVQDSSGLNRAVGVYSLLLNTSVEDLAIAAPGVSGTLPNKVTTHNAWTYDPVARHPTTNAITGAWIRN